MSAGRLASTETRASRSASMPSRSGVAASRSVRAITDRRSEPMSAQIAPASSSVPAEVSAPRRASKRSCSRRDPRLVAQQERARGDEVGVVVAVGLVGGRVHPVRRRREQQRPRRAAGLGFDVVEEAVGEFGGEVRGVRLQQVLEALELVEHHEIGTQRGDADDRHDPADLADQLAPAVAQSSSGNVRFHARPATSSSNSSRSVGLPCAARQRSASASWSRELRPRSPDPRSVPRLVSSEPLIAVARPRRPPRRSSAPARVITSAPQCARRNA